jgi:hypothetical protein
MVADEILGREPAIPAELDPGRFGALPPRGGRRWTRDDLHDRQALRER